jgi:hypothetical protein
MNLSATFNATTGFMGHLFRMVYLSISDKLALQSLL